MPLSLTPRQRAIFEARAHPLEPVVQVGASGGSDLVIAEVECALAAPGLIEVRLVGTDRESRQE